MRFLHILVLLIAGLVYGKPDVASYRIQPGTFDPWQETKVQLTGGDFACSHVFSHQDVQRSGDRFILSYHKSWSRKLCLDTTGSYGPVFELPALAPGNYPIVSRELPSCYVNQTCQVKFADIVVDTLVVRSDFRMEPERVSAAKPFTLQILSEQFTCASSFRSFHVDNRGDSSLHIRFVEETNPAIKCKEGKYGPKVSMPALKPGVYPIYVSVLPPCADPVCEIKWPCAICDIAIIPVHIGDLVVEDPVSSGKLILSPKAIPAQQESVVSLLSHNYSCAHRYSNRKVAVANGRITLTYSALAQPEVFCSMIYKPYGPEFKLPALPSGTYAVHGAEVPECYPGCKILIRPSFVDSLVVKADTVVSPGGWTLLPGRVAADTRTNVQLLHDRYGNCGTSFTDTKVSVRNRQITVSAQVAKSDHVCITDVRPFGPEVSLPPLAPGRYQVSFFEDFACWDQQPACGLPIRTESVGVLEVVDMHATSIAPGAHSAIASIQRWRVQLFNVQGERVKNLELEGNQAKLGRAGEWTEGLPEGLYSVMALADDGTRISKRLYIRNQ